MNGLVPDTTGAPTIDGTFGVIAPIKGIGCTSDHMASPNGMRCDEIAQATPHNVLTCDDGNGQKRVFTKKELLGEGIFGSVWKAQTDGWTVAIKIAKKANEELKAARLANQKLIENRVPKRGNCYEISKSHGFQTTAKRQRQVLDEWHGKKNIMYPGNQNTHVAHKTETSDTRIGETKQPCIHCSIAREWSILRDLKHPHIVSVFGCLSSPEGRVLFMAFLGDVDLFKATEDRLISNDEPTLASLFIQILHGLKFLHENSIIHCDIKLDNMMLTKENKIPVLIDFGLAQICKWDDKKRPETHIEGCTYAYASPEARMYPMDRVTMGSFNTDVFSAGAALVVAMLARHPELSETESIALPDDRMVHASGPTMNKKTGKLVLCQQKIVPTSATVKDLVRLMTECDPQKRPDAKDLLDHEWFQTNVQLGGAWGC